MTDRKLQQIDRRIADILEEIRILRADGHEAMAQSDARWAEERAARDARWAESDARWAESRARDLELFAEQRALVAEQQALRQTSDLHLAELRRISDTNAIQTDALRVLLGRGQA